MANCIDHAELLGVSESSLTVSFQVQDDAGEPTPEPARVLIDGEIRAQVDGHTPTRLVRIGATGLQASATRGSYLSTEEKYAEPS